MFEESLLCADTKLDLGDTVISIPDHSLCSLGASSSAGKKIQLKGNQYGREHVLPAPRGSGVLPGG